MRNYVFWKIINGENLKKIYFEKCVYIFENQNFAFAKLNENLNKIKYKNRNNYKNQNSYGGKLFHYIFV